jgi:ribosomal protein S18 acetylase RimI-like enzyme
MLHSPLQMTVFDPVDATDEEVEAYHRLANHIRRERWPEDRPKELEETAARLRKPPAFVVPQFWAVWQPQATELAAVGELYTYDVEHNQHVADFYIAVAPEVRRQGIARGLLRAIVAEAQA